LRHTKKANQWYRLSTNTNAARAARSRKKEIWIKEANRILRDNEADFKVFKTNGALNKSKTAEKLFEELKVRLPDAPVGSVESVRKAMSSGEIS